MEHSEAQADTAGLAHSLARGWTGTFGGTGSAAGRSLAVNPIPEDLLMCRPAEPVPKAKAKIVLSFELK